MNTLEIVEITQTEIEEAIQFAMQLRVQDRQSYEIAMSALGVKHDSTRHAD